MSTRFSSFKLAVGILKINISYYSKQPILAGTYSQPAIPGTLMHQHTRKFVQRKPCDEELAEKKIY